MPLVSHASSCVHPCVASSCADTQPAVSGGLTIIYQERINYGIYIKHINNFVLSLHISQIDF